MPVIEQGRMLAPLTTMGVGGPADAYIECSTVEELRDALSMARAGNVPLFVLGGGSNVLIADEGFRGLVVRPVMRGIVIVGGTGPGAVAGDRIDPVDRIDGGDGEKGAMGSADGATGQVNGAAGRAEEVVLRVGAGEPWDEVVKFAVDAGLAGLEALSGIPGLAGASPIQNIGAYGQEVARVITTVEALDRESGQVVRVPGEHCGFSYRDSRFKTGPDAGRYVVVAVEFGLRRTGTAPAKYGELRGRLAEAGHDPDAAPLAAIREAVLALRRSKGMVLDPADPDTRSCGSFFTNPILREEEWDGFLERCRQAGMLRDGAGKGEAGSTESLPPRFPAGPGLVKTSAAWLIERAGFGKGYRLPNSRPGAAGLSTKHCLALTNRGGALAREIRELAAEVRRGVLDKTGLVLVPEPVFVGMDGLG